MEEENGQLPLTATSLQEKFSKELEANSAGLRGGVEILSCALAGVAQWSECGPANHKVAGSIPSQGTCLGCQPGPWLGGVRDKQLMFPSLPPLPSPLRINKQNP